MIKKITLLSSVVALFFASCENGPNTIEVTAEDYHAAVDKVIEVQIHDIFSPPVASRIFAYTNIAAYEAMRPNEENYLPLAGQINDYSDAPKLADTTNFNNRVAGIVAYYEIAQTLLFSEARITTFRDSLYMSWEEIDPETFKKSKDYGVAVANHVKQWMSKDNYAQTRTMPKFTVRTEEEGRWQPTPPAYMDGIEPHWSKIRPFVIRRADQFMPPPPPEYSMEEGSKFHEELMEVYNTGNDLRKDESAKEKLEIAKFWDCNPYVSTHKGHLMFATKKITPGGHWIGITKIACRKTNADFEKTVAAYTQASLAIADGFISCWDEKYRSNLIRPETVINKFIDENWLPVLQTPPFPEYTSGHSVVSGAAGIVLTDFFGDNFQFDDDTEVPYGLPVRSFDSFNDASAEAAISRMYGGIHYRAAIEVGLKQGRNLGNYVIQNLQLVKENEQVASAK